MLDLSRLPQAFSEDYRATFFPDSGAFARDLFPKSLEFFEATKHFQNVNIFGSNRSSKSITLAYAAATWALGDYPDWWPGRVFAKPVKIWLCGETGLLVRNNLQRYVMGEKDHEGEHSFIKREDIVGYTYQTRPVGLCERVVIKSKYGGHSVIEFKSYDQGSVRFASDTIDVGILDEEPGTGIYSEVTTRTATTRGLVACGFTSVKGITPLIQTIAPEFCGGDAVDPAVSGIRNIVIGWQDIPETVLPAAERKRLYNSYSPSERGPRTTGIPQLGEGAVIPVAESEFVVPWFEIPESWPRLIGIDPGYQDPTGIVFGAYDMENDAIYIYGEYRKNLQHLSVHANVVHEHGDWIPCVIDPAGSSPADGEKVYEQYAAALRNPCTKANKTLTDGLGEMYDRMQDGRLFVFSTLRQWLGEFRAYARDDKGRMPKRTQDHHYDLMDATRYLVMGRQHFKMRPPGWHPKAHLRAYDASLPQQTLSLTDAIF